MEKSVLTVVMLFVSVVSFAQKLSQDKIVGIWQSEEYKIEIFESGNTYSAKLLWSKDIFETDGKTSKKDDKNPDETLRNRNRQGITHITGLTYNDGEYIDGKLYSAQDGNTYGFKAELKGVDELESRGYKGVPMFGKTVKWKRVP
ncbi:MAG: DUF2147 domain-containing protein [Sediminicola sp.]